MAILITILLSLMNTPTEKPTLIYVGDPMCSWCYGISDQLSETLTILDGKVDAQLYVGGLRPGGGDEWNEGFRSFLKHHWEDVSAASGMQFGYDLLAMDHFNYDTEPACRSVVVVQSMDISKQFDFFKAVQKKFYLDNQDPKVVDFYKSICEDLSLDFSDFSTKFKNESYKVGTATQFSEVRALGVSSFPTILLKHNGETKVIAKGYATASQMVATINSIVN